MLDEAIQHFLHPRNWSRRAEKYRRAGRRRRDSRANSKAWLAPRTSFDFLARSACARIRAHATSTSG